MADTETYWFTTDGGYCEGGYVVEFSMEGSWGVGIGIHTRISFYALWKSVSGYGAIDYNGYPIIWNGTGHAPIETSNDIHFSINVGEESPHYGHSDMTFGHGNNRQVGFDFGCSAYAVPGMNWSGTTRLTSFKIPTPVYTNIRASVYSVGVFDFSFSSYLDENPYNYWYLVLIDTNKQHIKDISNGINSLSGLQPSTNYRYGVTICGRDSVMVFGTDDRPEIFIIWMSFRTLDDQAIMWVNNNGTWRKAKVWVNNSGSWRKVRYAWTNVSGTWRKNVQG